MPSAPPVPPPERIAAFRDALGALIATHGGTRAPELEAQCVADIVSALAETSADGRSLSPLDVVRIRAGKFAALRLPAALYRDAPRLAALRREIHALARALVGDDGAQGSRF